MVGVGAKGVALVGVKQDEVSITPHSDRALFGKHAEHFGGSGGSQLHKAVEGNAATVNAAVVQQGQAELDARSTVGNFGKIVFAVLF